MGVCIHRREAHSIGSYCKMKEEVVLRLGLLQNNIDGSFLKFRFEKFEGRVRSGGNTVP